MKRSNGFSLLELMVVVCLLLIGITLVIPGFQSLFQGNQLQARAEAFQSAFQYARTEAIRLNQAVVLCQSSDGERCSAPDDGSWQGLLIRAAGAQVGQEQGPVLRQQQWTDTQMQVTPSEQLQLQQAAIRFNAQGLVRQFGSSQPMSGHLVFCQAESASGYRLVFESGGQMTLQPLTTGCGG